MRVRVHVHVHVRTRACAAVWCALLSLDLSCSNCGESASRLALRMILRIHRTPTTHPHPSTRPQQGCLGARVGEKRVMEITPHEGFASQGLRSRGVPPGTHVIAEVTRLLKRYTWRKQPKLSLSLSRKSPNMRFQTTNGPCADRWRS